MRSSRIILMTLIPALAVITAPLPVSIAQPQRGLAQTRPGVAPAQTTGAPAERLRKRLKTIDAERAKLQDAINRLDAGEPWEAVRADLVESGRPGRPGRRGGDREMDAPRDRGDRSRPRMDEDRIIELLGQVDPEAVDHFEQLRRRNPRMAGRLLQSKGPRLAKIVRLKESQPDLFEIEAEQFRIEERIMRTARAMHETVAGVGEAEAGVSIDETRRLLRELIARQVDLQIDGQRIQLESAKVRIDRLSAAIDERIASRDSIIEDRVERIMNRAVRGGVNRRLQQDGGGDRPRSRDHRPGRDHPGSDQSGPPDRP